MQSHIKKSYLSIGLIFLVFVCVSLVAYNLFAKSEWRLATIFLVSAISFLSLEFFVQNFLFVGKKIIQKDLHLYLLQEINFAQVSNFSDNSKNSDNSKKSNEFQEADRLLQITKLVYFSKFFILLKIERRFFNLVPIWADSLSPEDWHWLRLKVLQKIFFTYS